MIEDIDRISSICERLAVDSEQRFELLDLRGLKCPLPALRVRRALAGCPSGSLFRVLATDPMSIIDVPHEVSLAGATLLQQDREGEEIRFEIRAAG